MSTVVPTEAHLELAKNVIFSRDASGRLLTAQMAARLIAESEARALKSLAQSMKTSEDLYTAVIAEGDQLRADFATLTIQAAFTADANVSLRLQADQFRAENKAIHHELAVARNAECLARMQLDLARAERDKERARLDWLDSNRNEFGVMDGLKLLRLDETDLCSAIDAAMKEEGK